jgi:hypothetical protein
VHKDVYRLILTVFGHGGEATSAASRCHFGAELPTDRYEHRKEAADDLSDLQGSMRMAEDGWGSLSTVLMNPKTVVRPSGFGGLNPPSSSAMCTKRR